MHKKLRCPSCGSRIIDEAEQIRSEVKIFNTSDDWQPDYYAKCWNCKKEVGVKKLIEIKN